MSFNIEINSVLRTDNYSTIERGKTYPFNSSGNQKFSENNPLWLANTDWTARAEISMISQTLENNVIKGVFRVDYIYQGDEKNAISNIFDRMFSGLSDPYIYLLSSQAEYRQALNAGSLIRDSLQTEGFIHAAPKNQLNRLANKYHRNTEQPLILIVDKKLVSSDVKWEPATGGLYPHIYGALNMNAITNVEKISPSESGSFVL